MNRARKNILITGLPGVGKTTVVIRLPRSFSEVKKRVEVDLFELTEANRTTLAGELAHDVKTLLERR